MQVFNLAHDFKYCTEVSVCLLSVFDFVDVCLELRGLVFWIGPLLCIFATGIKVSEIIGKAWGIAPGFFFV